MARVLLWSNAFWPLIGGVEVLGDKLVHALSQRGHEFAVITDRPPNVPAYTLRNGVPIHRLPMLAAAGSGNIEQWIEVRTQTTAIKREFKPDVVWNYLVQVDAMFHLMTEASWPAPTLATLHASFAEGMLGEKSAVRRLVDSAAWVAACSSHALEHTRRAIPAITARSSVVWNGLDMPALAPKPLPYQAPRLLCLGRIGSKEEKGFDVAISAMVAVTSQFPSARLLIAGDGAGRAELEAHARQCNIAHAVDFLGWIHPDSVSSLINETTLVLMPSRVEEGFGLAALQAQQMSRPVIASRVGGVSEVIQHRETGLLVKSGDTAELSDAIVSLLRNEARATAMGIAGRLRAEWQFGFEKHVNAYDRLLQRLAAPQLAAELA